MWPKYQFQNKNRYFKNFLKICKNAFVFYLLYFVFSDGCLCLCFDWLVMERICADSLIVPRLWSLFLPHALVILIHIHIWKSEENVCKIQIHITIHEWKTVLKWVHDSRNWTELSLIKLTATKMQHDSFFRCDSDIGQWVGECVVGFSVFGFRRKLSHLPSLRACFPIILTIFIHLPWRPQS